MQAYQCPMCDGRTLAENVPYCDPCHHAMYPMWTVHTSKGKVVGEVAGFSLSDALVSVGESPKFDRYRALTVRPSMRKRKG